MTRDRATYVDSSALVKLVEDEPESRALRAYVRRRRWLVTSALARTELGRALLAGARAPRRTADDMLSSFELIRVNDRILRRAVELLPPTLRTLDAIHLASAEGVGDDLGRIVTYDARMAAGAEALRLTVAAPS